VPSRLASLPPGCQNRLDLIGNLLPGERATQTSGQQHIVPGVLVTNRGGNGRGQRRLLQATPCRRSPDAAASPHGNVFRDGSSITRRAAGKQGGYLPRHSGNQFTILLAAQRGPARSCSCTLAGIRRAFLLGFLQPSSFYEDALRTSGVAHKSGFGSLKNSPL